MENSGVPAIMVAGDVSAADRADAAGAPRDIAQTATAKETATRSQGRIGERVGDDGGQVRAGMGRAPTREGLPGGK